MIVYGRNAVREALRGRRNVTRLWADKNAAREPWLEGVSFKTVSSADLVGGSTTAVSLPDVITDLRIRVEQLDGVQETIEFRLPSELRSEETGAPRKATTTVR